MTVARDNDASAACDLSLSLQAAEWYRALPDVETICRRAAHAALAVAGTAAARPGTVEISIVLGNDGLIAEYNQAWRGRTGPTNVLSFPAAGAGNEAPHPGGTAPLLLGDVVVAYETASTEARAEGKELGDRLSHLIVHGVLHLLGFDHQTDDQAAGMEKLETEALDRLGITGLCWADCASIL